MTTEPKDLIEHEPAALPAVTGAESMLGLIGQMAANPAVDMDKVERLMALQVQMQERENEAAFNRVLAEAQGEIEIIHKNKYSIHTQSNYADLEAVVAAIVPIACAKHKITLSFNTGKVVDGCLPMTGYVSACGHTRECHYDSPISTKGTGGKVMMTDAHAKASAAKYARRYLQEMIFNVATSDDDGNAATPIERITPEQVADLDALIEDVGADKKLFLRWTGAASLDQIQAAAYDNCVKMLERKRR